jgi:hypothetical protein
MKVGESTKSSMINLYKWKNIHFFPNSDFETDPIYMKNKKSQNCALLS